MDKHERREREGEKVGQREGVIRRYSPRVERHLEMIGLDEPEPWAPGGRMLCQMQEALAWVRPVLAAKAPFALWVPETQSAYSALWDIVWDRSTPKVFARAIEKLLCTARV